MRGLGRGAMTLTHSTTKSEDWLKQEVLLAAVTQYPFSMKKKKEISHSLLVNPWHAHICHNVIHKLLGAGVFWRLIVLKHRFFFNQESILSSLLHICLCFLAFIYTKKPPKTTWNCFPLLFGLWYFVLSLEKPHQAFHTKPSWASQKPTQLAS